MEHAPERANFILPWRCPEAECLGHSLRAAAPKRLHEVLERSQAANADALERHGARTLGDAEHAGR